MVETTLTQLKGRKRFVVISFIHSGYFLSASSSPLLLRGASDYSLETVSELTRQKRYRQLRVKDLPKVPTWRLEWDSNLRPSGRKTPNLSLSHRAPQFD